MNFFFVCLSILCGLLNAQSFQEIHNQCYNGLIPSEVCCKLVPNGKLVHLKHPEDCNKYIVCNKIEQEILLCPNGYHMTNGKCVHPSVSDCVEDKSLKGSTFRERCLYGKEDRRKCCLLIPSPFEFRNPKNCGTYYTCIRKKPALRSCPKGLHWGVKERRCVKPATAKCQHMIPTTTIKPTTTRQTTLRPTTIKTTTTANPTTEKPTTVATITTEEIFTTTEKTTTKEPTTVEPITDEPTTEKPTTEEPITEKPTTEKPTTEEPTTEKPTTEKPTTEKPTTEQPTTEKPTTEEPTTEKPTTQESTTQKPTTIAETTIKETEKPTTEATPTTKEPITTTRQPTTQDMETPGTPPSSTSKSCLEGLISAHECCKGVPSWINVLLRNPDNIFTYYQCVNEKPMLRKCPKGLQWNVNKYRCDYLRN